MDLEAWPGEVRSRWRSDCAHHSHGGTANDDGPEHTQVWFGPESRPLYGWVSRPAGGLARGGAVLCPPMGEEGRAAHRTFRRLAEELAAAGIVALRFDYDGTGDSAGLQDDPDRVPSWLASIEAARQYLLDLGAPERGRGRHAARRDPGRGQAAPRRTPYSSLVCWDPCLSGRTFLREGEALYGFGEDAPSRCPTTGCGTRPASSTTRTPPRSCAASTSASSRPTGRWPTGCCC